MTAINGGVENNRGAPLQFDGQVFTPSPGRIRKLSDVPYVQAMDIKPPEYLAAGIISRGSITMLAGPPGSLKTYLMLRLAISVASGSEFLGRPCKQCPVLILDYENPVHEIRWRLDAMTAETLIPNLYVWGIWNEQQPPKIGDPLLLSIADEEKPLIIFDPFRNAHGCDENSSTEMAGIMEQLVYMKSKGATVILLHHVAKAEGSTSRGSSAIDGAVDLALVQTKDAESGIMELKTIKNRFGEGYCLSIRPDFDQHTFSITNSPQFAKRTAEIEKLGEIIGKQPGLSQNAIIEASGMMRARVIDLLRKNTGTLWTVEPGAKRSKNYYPPNWFSNPRTTDRTIELVTKNEVGGSSGSPLKGREPQNHSTIERHSTGSNGKALPSCRNCGSFAIYTDGSCQSCDAGGAAC